MIAGSFGGMTSAQVKQVNDPEGLGRVTVLFQGDSGLAESGWLQVMSFYGGPDGGAFLLPKEGDSVLVAFADGDLNRGFVLGCLRSGSTTHNSIAVESSGDVTITAANTMTLKANQIVIQNTSGSVKLDLTMSSLQAMGGQSMKLSAAVIDIN